MGSLLFIVWCAIYYLFWCCFFRFYYQRKPYVLTPKIFDSLIPSTKDSFYYAGFGYFACVSAVLPLFFGLPEDVLDEYTTGFIQEYMDEKDLWLGMTVILILVTPLIFTGRCLPGFRQLSGAAVLCGMLGAEPEGITAASCWWLSPLILRHFWLIGRIICCICLTGWILFWDLHWWFLQYIYRKSHMISFSGFRYGVIVADLWNLSNLARLMLPARRIRDIVKSRGNHKIWQSKPPDKCSGF